MRKSLRLLASLLIGLGWLVLPFVATTAAWADNTQRIFYVDDGSNLVSVNPDGSDSQVIATNANQFGVQASPNGQKIAFVEYTNNSIDLATVNSDGSGFKDLTNYSSNVSVDEFNISWSPDGSKIAYALDSNRGNDIYTINSDGSDNTDLTTISGVGGEEPDWSPNGNQILFIGSYGISTPGAYVMNSDGTNPYLVVPNADSALWSPDGNKISVNIVDCCTSPSDTKGIANADGSNLIIFSSGGSDFAPVWAPDGSRVADPAMSVDSTGGNPIYFSGFTNGRNPAWSPNSSSLTYSSQNNLYTVPATGGPATQISSDSSYIWNTYWFVVSPPAPSVTVGSISAPNSEAKGTTLTASGSFTDTVDESPYTARWDWGDGNTTPGTVTAAGATGSVSDIHTYTTAGSHKITLTVTDSSGASSAGSFVIAVSPGSNFQNAHISGFNFDNSDLSNQNLSNAQAQNASFQNVNFAGANLSNAQMQYANLTGANLSGANLSNAQLQYSNLTNANLSGANAHNAHFDNAVILGAIWSDTICPDNTNSDNDGMTCVGHGL